MEVEEIVNSIFKEYYQIDFKEHGKLKDSNLLGRKFSFAPRDLVILLVKIEDGLKVKISNNDLAEGKFSTFAQIVDLCKKKLYEGGDAS